MSRCGAPAATDGFLALEGDVLRRVASTADAQGRDRRGDAQPRSDDTGDDQHGVREQREITLQQAKS